ncbi:MAG: hypothetical protein HEP71_06700 [Roseivirga sp.]|nr:hypothetical protein [Roseivirga sp.]
MNIYALNGHKVRLIRTDMGYEYQKERAEKYLKLRGVYTVDYTEVHSGSTEVYLEEVPDLAFNSTCFEDIKPQSPEDDSRHEDYDRWNA